MDNVLTQTSPTERTAHFDHVVLVHGFGAHASFLTRLERRLSNPDRVAKRWGYRSLRVAIDQLASEFANVLQQLGGDPNLRCIHLVTHSMGCIIARAALQQHTPGNLGRWVMLAPPNRGAYSAATWAWPLGLLFPPVRQLSTSSDSYVNQLPEPERVEFGVISASRDWIVRERDTHLPTQQDHLILPCIHSQLLFDRQTAEQVSYFLEHGRFHREQIDVNR